MSYAYLLTITFWTCLSAALIISQIFNNLNSIYSTSIYGNSHDIKTWPLADLSGYFVIGYNPSNVAKICKYTFSSLKAQCQTINNVNTGYGHLMISNSQFFVIGADMASPYNLHIYKITFLLTSVDWAMQVACSSGTWVSYYSESVLSSDRSTIYSFFIFGVTKYVYFAGLSVSDGSVATTRFKSSMAVPDFYGSALNGDYVIATVSGPSCILIYSISASTFTIKTFTPGTVRGWAVEPSSGR